MPNWIKNRITFQGEREIIEKAFETIKGEEELIDFNKVIPMPETYRKYDTTNHPDGIGIEDLKEKQAYIKATKEQRRKYGVVGWYDWRCFNWGVKWSACDSLRLDDTLEFLTPWDGVPKIVAKIVKMFPELYIEYAYADEDAGYNVGTGNGENGEWYFSLEQGGSPEAWSVYFDLWNCEDEYEMVDGQWRLKEDEEE